MCCINNIVPPTETSCNKLYRQSCYNCFIYYIYIIWLIRIWMPNYAQNSPCQVPYITHPTANGQSEWLIYGNLVYWKSPPKTGGFVWKLSTFVSHNLMFYWWKNCKSKYLTVLKKSDRIFFWRFFFSA